MPLLLLALACAGGPDTGDSSGGGALDPLAAIPLDGTPRNLLILSLDTFRLDALAPWGGRGAADELDALLEASWRLDDHRSCSNWTWSSLTCALTGRSTNAVGMEPAEPDTLPDDATLLAERLRRAGFETALVSSNTFFSRSYGLAQGFDRRIEDGAMTADAVREHALALYDEIAGADRWLLHAHFIDPHLPWRAPDDYLGALDDLDPIDWDLTGSELYAMEAAWPTLSPEEQALVQSHLEALYEAEIAWTDDQVGGLVRDLEDAGALEDTLVLLFTDHGEQLMDHDRVGHGISLYAEEVDALAALYMPGALEPGAWGGPTEHRDLTPTLLAMLGLQVPEVLGGVVIGQASDDRDRFSQRYGGASTLQAVERAGDKLIYSWDGALRYHRRGEDPGEQDDRFDPSDARVQALWGALAPEVEALYALHPDGAAPADPGL